MSAIITELSPRLERARKYERILMRIRERYASYHEAGMGGKASELISKCKLRATPWWTYKDKLRAAKHTACRG